MTASLQSAGGAWRLQIGNMARAERTENMIDMLVTLDVSKLSGWLNADAHCRESEGGHTVMQGELRSGGAGRWRAIAVRNQRAGEGSTADWVQIGGRARGEERTRNMENMVVTLDVSKLSGWLNADAR